MAVTWIGSLAIIAIREIEKQFYIIILWMSMVLRKIAITMSLDLYGSLWFWRLECLHSYTSHTLMVTPCWLSHHVFTILRICKCVYSNASCILANLSWCIELLEKCTTIGLIRASNCLHVSLTSMFFEVACKHKFVRWA